MTKIFPKVSACNAFNYLQGKNAMAMESNRMNSKGCTQRREDRKRSIAKKANRGWLSHAGEVADALYEHHSKAVLSGLLVFSSVSGLAAVIYITGSRGNV